MPFTPADSSPPAASSASSASSSISSRTPKSRTHVPPWVASLLRLPWNPDTIAFGPKLFGSWATNNAFGLIMFILLAASLFYFARKKLD